MCAATQHIFNATPNPRPGIIRRGGPAGIAMQTTKPEAPTHTRRDHPSAIEAPYMNAPVTTHSAMSATELTELDENSCVGILNDSDTRPQAAAKTASVHSLLSAGKLNVIGEHHIESDARREAEETIAKTVAKGPYWYEYEFNLIDDLNNPWEGDPLELRTKHLQTNARDMLQWINFQPDTFDPKRNKVLGMREDLDLLKVQLEALRAHRRAIYKNGLENIGGIDSEASDKKQLELIKNTKKVLKLLKSRSKISLKSIRLFNENLEWFSTAFFTDLKTTTEDISRQRSHAMHRAANTFHSTKGIWKIGQAHVDHIKDEPKSPRYNLISKTEFDDYYQHWLAQTQAKQSPANPNHIEVGHRPAAGRRRGWRSLLRCFWRE